jgi:hypothetical protein
VILLWLALAALALLAVVNLVLYSAQRWERLNNRDWEMAVNLKASEIALKMLREMKEENQITIVQ